MRYCFEGVQFDPAERLLTSQIASVRMEPLTADLLLYLLVNRDHVVSKDDLLCDIWHGRIVSDSTVTSRISVTRNALIACGAGRDCIRTIARSGVRFVAPVMVESPRHAGDAGPTAAAIRRETGAPAAGARDKPVLSIRRFAAPPVEADAVEFALGLHEDLLTVFYGSGWPTHAVATSDALPAGLPGYAVEGRVRQNGRSLVVTARLVDTRTSEALCCVRLDADGTGPDAEGAIAASIHGSFESHLEKVVREAATLPENQQTPLQLYLAGRTHLFGWHPAGLDTALALFKSAIEIAPDYGPAHAMAAYCHVQRKSFGCLGDRSHAVREAEFLARTATQLMPRDPTALAMGAHALASVVDDLDGAFSMTERAIGQGQLSANPYYVEGWLHLFLGQPEKAIDRLGMAARLVGFHPMAFKISGAMSYACLMLGRYSEGARHAERAISEQPTYLTGLRGAAANLVLAGERERAIALVRRMRAVDPGLRVRGLGQLLPFRKAAHLDKWASALRWAGLPD